MPIDAAAGPMIVARINVGGPAVTGVETDNAGDWSEDQTACTGSLPSGGPEPQVNNTADDDLYRFFRFGTVSCSIAVPNGSYQVRFLLAEVFRGGGVCDARTSRVKALQLEGVEIDSVDLVATTGGCASDPGQAGAAPFDVISMVDVDDGQLDIAAVPDGDNALLGAVEVVAP